MLPEGAPSISAALADAAGKIPALPDLPLELPDLPPAPVLPALPTPAVPGALVKEVTVTPVGAAVPAVARAPSARFLY